MFPNPPSDFKLLLASSSPRRRDLLTAAGIPFEAVPSEAQEATGGSDPRGLVEHNALTKARGARLPADTGEGTFVLGADTVVVEGGSILGKPSDADEAAGMLHRFPVRSTTW